MHIGILQFELIIDHAQSLKDKRRVVRSIKDRLHREHLVGIAEVGSLEVWNLATMGAVCCSGSASYCQGVLDAIVSKLGTHPEARLGECVAEVISASQATSFTDDDGTDLWTEDERRIETEDSDDDDGDPEEDDDDNGVIVLDDDVADPDGDEDDVADDGAGERA